MDGQCKTGQWMTLMRMEQWMETKRKMDSKISEEVG
jgi:hypothetical protein